MTNADEKKIKPQANGEVRQQLELELKHLRGLVREAGENFILRREGEIETIIGHLDNIPPRKLKAEAAAILHEIRNLKLKPGKGRLKDVKEIDAVIDLLADRVISAQEGAKHTGKNKG